MQTHITAPAGPQPNGTDMLRALTHEELGILGAHLTSGWYKMPVVYGMLSGPWQETEEILSDIHRAHTVIFDAENAARDAGRDAR
jgi:hypothetical protein